MADDTPTDEEYNLWRTPAQALRQVVAVLEKDSLAKNAIITRLRGDRIRSAARGWANERIGGEVQTEKTVVLVKPRSWLEYDVITHSRIFWATGDFQFSPPGALSRTVTFYSVRFDPVGLDAFVEELTVETTPTASLVITEQARTVDASEQRGPPVTDMLLTEWRKLYERAYGGTAQDTLAYAVKSAKGMFPGKSVARDRVHALFAGRKTGKKPTSKSD